LGLLEDLQERIGAGFPAPAPAARTVNVNLTLGGRSATIPTSESGADALLKILEQAQGSLGR
jgi:hypothetical protein